MPTIKIGIYRFRLSSHGFGSLTDALLKGQLQLVKSKSQFRKNITEISITLLPLES